MKEKVWDFPANLYDVMFFEHRKDDTNFLVKQALKFGSPVLAPACGTGRVAIPMARAGLEVTAFDIAPEYVARFKENLKEEKGGVQKRIKLLKKPLDVSDMGKLDKEYSFAFFVWGSFSYILGRRRQEKTIQNILRNLKPGGKMIIDGPNYQNRMGQPNETEYEYMATQIDKETGKICVCFHKADWDWANQLTKKYYRFDIVDQNGKITRTRDYIYTLRINFKDEMVLLLEKNGFVINDIIGDFKGKKFKSDSKRLIFRAQKP